MSLAYSINLYGKDDSYTVQGGIVDNFTDKYLDSVLVTLMTNDSTVLSSTMTDKEGFYVFEISKTGKYIVKAERKGYEIAYKDCELRSLREFYVGVKRIRM